MHKTNQLDSYSSHQQDLKVREALEIRCNNSDNEDFGAYVKTAMWDPVFLKKCSTKTKGERGPTLDWVLF